MRPDINEVLRYLGSGDRAPESLRLLTESIAARLSVALQPRYVYRVFPLHRQGDRLFISDTDIVLESRSAAKMLAQCNQVILLACTLGTAFDTMLRTEQARNMADAVILDACGSALVEAGCDAAEAELRARFPARYLTDRFSPGYGDLPLDLQPEICAALDTRRRVGIHVTESFLLNPSKSVTALIGLSDQPQMARIRGCDYCMMRETCMLRKGGKRCAI